MGDLTIDSNSALTLAPPAHRLHPVFPQIIDRTRIVLFAGQGGALHVDWHLRPNDLVKFAVSFPPDGGMITPVVRLRRIDGDGRSSLIGARRIAPPGVGGGGETIFAVGRDHACFQAELGLVNAEGGWLSLARSNRLQHASSLGLPFQAGGAAVLGAGEAAIDQIEGTPRGSPMEGEELESTGLASYPSRDPSSIDALGVEPRIPPLGRPWPVDDGDPVPSILEGDAGHPARGGEREQTARIPCLIYGEPVVRGSGLVVEAELRIQGWAAPNSEIDLFGHPYLVGPGGRFQFLIKVEDPELLRRALDLRPPPELSRPREE